MHPDIHGPEPAISRHIFQEFLFVACTEEYTPSGIFIRPASISSTIDIIRLTQELLDGIRLLLRHGCQFPYLIDPGPLYQFRRFLTFKTGQ